MGSTNAPAESSAKLMESYDKYLPGLVSKTSSLQPEVARQQLLATQQTQPGYDALNLAETQKYSLPLAQIGQQVTNSNALAGAQTNLAQLRGAGGDVARESLALARESNPNYYRVQDAASQQAVNLLNSINLRGLSPGEQNATERGLNQAAGGTGNMGLGNATNAVSNAMNFGGAFNNKLGILGNALGAANSTANSAQNTGFSPINLAIGQPNASTMGNFGTGTFSAGNASTQNASAQNTFGAGSGLLGNLNQNQMNAANNQVALAGQNKQMASSMFSGVMSSM